MKSEFNSIQLLQNIMSLMEFGSDEQKKILTDLNTIVASRVTSRILDIVDEKDMPKYAQLISNEEISAEGINSFYNLLSKDYGEQTVNEILMIPVLESFLETVELLLDSCDEELKSKLRTYLAKDPEFMKIYIASREKSAIEDGN